MSGCISQRGAAIHVNGGHLTVRRTLFARNVATGDGSIVWLQGANARFEECRFEDNSASGEPARQLAFALLLRISPSQRFD
jgi:hypothetical protein